MIYIDTSSLIKRYLPEAESAEFESALLASSLPYYVSELSKIEIVSALKRRLRQGLIQTDFFDLALDYFYSELAQGHFTVVPLSQAILYRATKLAQNSAAPIATLDSIHLATALELDVKTLFTHDAQLARAALEAGLSVYPNTL